MKILSSISVKNYRSIGEEWLSLDLNDINVLIGRNNSGKTNILCLLKSLNGVLLAHPVLPTNSFEQEDMYEYGASAIEIKLTINLEGDGSFAKRKRAGFTEWYAHYRVSSDFKNLELIEDSLNELDQDYIRELSRAFTQSSSSLHTDNIKSVRNYLDLNEGFPTIDVVELNTSDRLNLTESVRDTIYQLTHPTPTLAVNSRKRISDILEPVTELLGKSVQFRPENKTEPPQLIFDNDEDHPYRFTRVASGIQSLIVLFIEITQHNNKIILIDEPENHLHPALQKSFLRHIERLKEKNQFFIASHSSSMLDLEVEKAVIALGIEDRKTKIDKTYADLQKIVADLGYRPSDIIQANGVIWVEGPSDRIYMNRWINIVSEKLVEGIHYTFQFYGGSLLGRLSTEGADEEIDKSKLSILALNPNYYFVMDSDQTKEFEVNDLVKRQRVLIENLKKTNNSNFMVTACRTIENYLADEILKTEKFENPEPKLKKPKVNFAISAVEKINEINFDKYGLKDEIIKLCSVIESWNKV